MSQPAVRPVVLPGPLRSGLASQRIRALVLPLEWRSLRPGDLLWVQEPVTIEARHFRPGQIWARYSGWGRALPTDWPDRKPQPRPGYVKAADMPQECSRFTLRVVWVHRLSLTQVGIPLAVECGVTGKVGSWTPCGAPEGFLPYGRVYDALRVTFEEMGGKRGFRSPAVTVVQFECLARNVGRVLAREVDA